MRKNRFVWLCFICYVGILLYLVFFSEQFGRSCPDRVYRYNLTPFREIGRYLRHFHTLGIHAAVNLAGNILVFVPFGAVLPKLWNPARKCFNMVFYTFLSSISIETIQLFFRVGSFDVDDIILNTLGGFVGFLLYLLEE